MIGRKGKVLTAIVTGILAVSITGCGTAAPNSAQASGQKANSGPVSLTEAGSTFVQPLLTRQVAKYQEENPNVKISVQGGGSGFGIAQLQKQLLDFGASDAFMSDADLAKAQGGTILELPIALGSVTISYNVPGLPQHIKISPDTLADIYLGKISNWNDPKLAKDNPGVKFPNLAIVPVHRAEGSGTTSIFTHYLASVSPEWASKVGKGISVNWPNPTGKVIGEKGNPGVAGAVKNTTGAIGYIELAYALENNIPYAYMHNKAGKWVLPSLEGAAADAAAFTIPEDMRVNIVNAPGDAAYPISGFSWALVYQKQTDKAKGEALVNFLKWDFTKGQSLAPSLQYVPLPDNLTKREIDMLKTITYNGQPLLK
ncbi:phosphate-binding protein PstS precursor [Peptococcaceae bacterium CEB3]|nr:phosphate-binding protein PstS precursor [Peptococcaceae bacterium CEB3]